MSKTTFLSSMLTFILSLACTAGWAQTTYAVTQQTAAPADGYYVIYSESSSGKGWIHYNPSLDRKYRVNNETGFDLSAGVTSDQTAYIWKLTNGSNGTFTLLNAKSSIYMPADDGMNQNMSYTETAKLAVSAVEGKTGFWYVNQTNYKNGNNLMYIHTNSPGGHPNLSYWENCSANGTSIRACFYKVNELEDITYIINFVDSEGNAVASEQYSCLNTMTITETILRELCPEGYSIKSFSNSDQTYTVVVAKALLTPGATYYIYCDNDSRQYFYDNGGSLDVSVKREHFSKKYLFTCSFDGQYYQFKNLSGKYLGHKALSNSAYNFELREYTVQGENRIALYSVAANKYLVMNTNGTFGQADNTYDAGATDFSTSYKFEEYTLPKDGETYYIYSDTYVNGAYLPRYLYADGSSLKLSTGAQNAAAYQWTAKVTDDGYVQFRNGNGKYLVHKGIGDNAYNFTLAREKANHDIAATLYSVNASRYFVVKNDGTTFDQSTSTYNQTSGDWCTDFVFIPTSEVKMLSVTAPGRAKGTATWNNETQQLPASWMVLPGMSITSPELTVNLKGTYTLDDLTEGGTSLGKTVSISEVNTNRTIIAKVSPAFFSATYGEKWVRLQNCSNKSYWANVETAAANGKGKTATLDITADSQLWCLVGNAESFVLYNKAAGESLALNVPLTGTNTSSASGDEAILTATKGTWKLIEQDFGYALVPTSHPNNSNLGINMWAGAGGYLKVYATGSSNTGSYWTPQLIDTDNTLTIGVSVDQVWASSPRVAELTVTLDGNTSTSRILGNVAAQTYYLPVEATFSLSSMTYRGYTFNGFTDAGNHSQETYENADLSGGSLTLTASYTANNERTLFYTPRDGHPYRIPAIATAPNGDIFAICDYRPCGNDIGYGEVDLVCRVSKDNGVTWSDEKCIADGLGHINNGIWKMGFGDPAIVADREHNEVLVMSVCGNRTCWDGNYGEENENPNRVSRIRIKYDENTGEWIYSEPQEVTYDIYPKFKDSEGNVHAASLFIGAGKICQSRVVKKGKYYRLYCAVWNVTMTQRQHHNYVIYSDDFGETWNVLGELGYENCPSKYGNEPKCEELPDGTVVLSSRKYNGRYFNLFKFDDDTYATGSWGQEASSNDVEGGLSFGGNSTNGEIYRVKAVRKSDQKVCDLMLQSIPTGSGRSDVAIYYKEMAYNEDYTPQTFSTGWTLGKQVSTKESCYSTMIMQADGRLGFFFEEAPGGYCMVYIPYTLEEVTGGLYGACKQNQTSFLLSDAHSVLQKTGVGYPKMESTTRETLKNAMKTFENSELGINDLETLNQAIVTYQKDGSCIQMPEDGKVYFICNVQKNGKTYMLSHEYDNAYLPEATEGAKDNTGNLFVCRTTENGYVLVNAQHGQYMLYHGINKTNPYETDGFSDTFSEKNELKLHSQANDRFGTLSIAGKRNRTDNVNGFATMTINPEGNMNANSGENNSTYDQDYSSLFTFEEVTYANTPQLNTATGIEGIEAIATFSAPFATAIPEGVTAYYAESEMDGTVNMTPIEGCIPADKGVLLTGAAGRVTMVPALDETRPSMEDNLLKSSAGNARSISLEENAFILSKANGKVGFYALSKDESKRTIGMNKSYLVLPTGSQVSKLNFGGRPTDIETIEQNTNAQAPIYDLSGRRVMKMVKGGIYIQNNKKFIAK